MKLALLLTSLASTSMVLAGRFEHYVCHCKNGSSGKVITYGADYGNGCEIFTGQDGCYSANPQGCTVFTAGDSKFDAESSLVPGNMKRLNYLIHFTSHNEFEMEGFPKVKTDTCGEYVISDDAVGRVCDEVCDPFGGRTSAFDVSANHGRGCDNYPGDGEQVC